MSARHIHPDVLRLDDMLQAIADMLEGGKLTEKKEMYSDIPWASIIGIRNKIVHEYGKVDVKLLQGVIDAELPSLQEKLRGIRDLLPSGE